MKSFVYDLFNSFLSDVFASNDENEDITPKKLITAVKDYENRTSIIKDMITIHLGTFDESWEHKIEKSLTLEEKRFLLHSNRDS